MKRGKATGASVQPGAGRIGDCSLKISAAYAEAQLRAAVEREREACAKIADYFLRDHECLRKPTKPCDCVACNVLRRVIAAIRTRGKK